ncbi:hypothetical protein [Metabacillus niabensis]|uniref:hypothetical protein n=1 Tax=Metabacillus niabensis TaxID=324854 RepID=UPI001CFB57C8|nr:hypothetical protein [Metabacillus niabensis]
MIQEILQTIEEVNIVYQYLVSIIYYRVCAFFRGFRCCANRNIIRLAFYFCSYRWDYC